MNSLESRVILNDKSNNNNNNNNKKYSNMNNTTTKKKKFLLCFKPMTMDGLEDDPVFKYFTVEEKQGMLFPVISNPSTAPGKKEEQEEEEEKGGGRRKKGRNVKLSRFLKAVFTGTFLAKKLKKRKHGESSFRSEPIIAEKGVKTINSEDKDSLKQDDHDNLRINSNISSCSRCSSSAFTATTMCSSCSSSSSSTSNSRSMSQRRNSFGSTLTGSNSQNKQRQDKNDSVQNHEKRSFGFYVGFCLPLVCLLVLVFWGKIFAILFTSMGFFMVRWSGSRCALPEVGIKSSEFDSVEYKKKVIMAGLLKRDRAHEL